jgi:hypothetical protein
MPTRRKKPPPKPATLATTALAVSPRTAAHLLETSVSRIYQMMRAGELENFHNNTSRRILMKSIKGYIARQLAVAKASQQAEESA